MRNVLVLFVLLLVLLPFSASATDYYVDATGGDDNNPGTSEGQAWQTISEVNSRNFSPGDQILFKRGETWKDRLSPQYSGSSGNPITFGAYGTGVKPIITGRESIPGWNTSGNWTDNGGDVWYISMVDTPYRLFLDGIEYIESDAIVNIDNMERWVHDSGNDRLYVYATANPASFYSSMDGGRVSITNVIFVNQKNYITFKDLEVQGGKVAIFIYASNYITVDSCTIAKYSYTGVTVSGRPADPWQISTYCEIKNCTVKSYYNNLNFDQKTLEAMDGIALIYGSQYCKAHDNVIQDFNHIGISITNTNGNFRTHSNEVYDNDISCPNVNYCRGIAFSTNQIGDNYCDHNKAYRNYIHDTSVRNQIHGNHNEFYYNIIENVFDTVHITNEISDGISLFAANGEVCHDNKIYNNVIYNTAHNGIKIYGWTGWGDKKDNLIRNNIIMNWGDENYGIYIDDRADVKNNIYENNLFYKPNVSDVVYYGHDTSDDYPHTIEEFNAENGTAGDVIGNNIDSSPLFADPANSDFRLQLDSPAIDNGTDVGLILDLDGNHVPYGIYPDIGAYEFGSSPPSCTGDCYPNTCDSYSNCSTASGTCSGGEYCCSGACMAGDANPIAFYHFDEGFGATAGDSSGNGNDGIIYGSNWTNDSISGNALELDGIDDYVDYGDVVDINVEAISISMWIKPGTQSDNNIFLSKGTYRNAGWYFWVYSDGRIELRTNNASSHEVDTASSFFTFNEWQHIAVVLNKTKIYWYKNGNPFATNPDGDISIDWTLPTGLDFIIGDYSGSHGNYNFNGTIDEVRVYNQLLSQGEILEIYNEESGYTPADLNNDGYVNLLDLQEVTSRFGLIDTDPGWDPIADLTTPYGEIDVFDLVFVASRFT